MSLPLTAEMLEVVTQLTGGMDSTISREEIEVVKDMARIIRNIRETELRMPIQKKETTTIRLTKTRVQIHSFRRKMIDEISIHQS